MYLKIISFFKKLFFQTVSSWPWKYLWVVCK